MEKVAVGIPTTTFSVWFYLALVRFVFGQQIKTKINKMDFIIALVE